MWKNTLGGQSTMGNQLCCGRSWSCPSCFHKKKKRGSRTPGRPERQRKSAQGREAVGHTYELVPALPASGQASGGRQPEDSGLHYADIQVCRAAAPGAAGPPKPLHVQSATEYATIRFPQAARRYDSKNGTLV